MHTVALIEYGFSLQCILVSYIFGKSESERKLKPIMECSCMLIKLPKDKENGNAMCWRFGCVSQGLNRAGPFLCVPVIRDGLVLSF